MGDRGGYARKVPRILLSFADETSISGRDCYIPNFWYVAVTGELVVELLSHVYCMENYDNCVAVMINAFVMESIEHGLEFMLLNY